MANKTKRELFVDVRKGTLYLWGYISQTVNIKKFQDRGGMVVFGNPDSPSAVTVDGTVYVGGTTTLCKHAKSKPVRAH